MTVAEFAERIMLNLPFDPTPQQTVVIAGLARFCCGEPPGDAVFLLNGYAGTGKTSVVSALVKTLREINAPTVLLAPTGRAAKVFGTMAGHSAYTIHRRIYRMPGPGNQPGHVSLNVNRLRSGVFIVDEASMIGDEPGEMTGASLLDDLLEFVFTGVGSRLIFLGDTAQLPPVGCPVSPALDISRLKRAGLKITRAVMTQVVRQDSQSGILFNATSLRRIMRKHPLPVPHFAVSRFDDMKLVDGYELADEIATAYARDGIENTLLVTRTNRAATAANMTIRSRVLGCEEELCRGERLLVVKNNYLWNKPADGVDFIANGDMATVTAIHRTENRHGLRFADVTLALTHLEVEIDCKIILDTLTADTPALPRGMMESLYHSRLTDPTLHSPDATMGQRMAALRTDPWFNALQVKYAYAVTCHKAQGGQWMNVMVDMSAAASSPIQNHSGEPADEAGHENAMTELYRWLYTAFTRATSRLYLINTPDNLVN